MGSSSSSSRFCKNKQNKKLLAKRKTTHLEKFLEKEKRREETTHLENFLEKEKRREEKRRALLEKILGKRDDPFVVS
jgi:hypothetical protein